MVVTHRTMATQSVLFEQAKSSLQQLVLTQVSHAWGVNTSEPQAAPASFPAHSFPHPVSTQVMKLS